MCVRKDYLDSSVKSSITAQVSTRQPSQSEAQLTLISPGLVDEEAGEVEHEQGGLEVG